MKIIVTGGAGFIGSHLVDALVARGDTVRVIDNLLTGKKERVNLHAEFSEYDICDHEAILPLFDGIDAVVHLAALVSVPLSIEQPWDAHRHNVDGTISVLRAAHECRVKRVVFASSCAVYGENGLRRQHEQALLRPQSPYAAQKLTGEEYCRLFSNLWDLDTLCLRLFNVYGSTRQSETGGYASVMVAFAKRINEGKPLVIFGDGEQTRDYLHWSDAVSAMSRAIGADVAPGSVFNIGSGREASVNRVADLFGRDRSRRTYLPARLGEIRHVVADIAKAADELGWEPKTALEEGIRGYLRSARSIV